MKIIQLALLITVNLITQFVIAQPIFTNKIDAISLPQNIITKSPTVRGITEANLSSLEHSTGKFPYNIALHKLNFEGIEIDLSITNSGNPIKINELSGILGIGWNFSFLLFKDKVYPSFKLSDFWGYLQLNLLQ